MRQQGGNVAKRAVKTAAKDAAAVSAAASAAELEPPDGDIENLRPGQNIEPARFWEVARTYTPRNRLNFYVYRRYPIIDLALIGSTVTYIDRIKPTDLGTFTEETLLRRHGSGDYRVCLCDNGKPSGHTRIAETHISIRDDEYPPVVEPKSVVMGDPDNKGYIASLQARKQLEVESVSVQNGSTELGQQALSLLAARLPPPGEMAAVVDRIGANFERALEKLEARSAAASGGGGMLDIFRLMNEQQQRFNDTLLGLMGQQNRNPVDDDLSRLERFDSFLSKRHNPESGGSWVKDLLKAAPLIIAMGAQMIAASKNPQEAQAMAQQAAAVSRRIAETDGESEAEPDVMEAETEDTNEVPKAAAVKQLLNRAWDAFKRGYSGQAFAASICLQFGESTYQQIVSEGNLDLFLFAFQNDPDFGSQVAECEPDLRKFISEFLSGPGK